MHYSVASRSNLTAPAATDSGLRYAKPDRPDAGPPVPAPTGTADPGEPGADQHTLVHRTLVHRRSMMFAVLAMIVGVVLGVILEPTVPIALQPYLPIAVVAALDAVFGGIRARLDGIFDDKQFVISFVSNVLVAALIVYLGDQLGVGGQLSTGVVVVLGVRIFGNVAAIRRHLFRA